MVLWVDVVAVCVRGVGWVYGGGGAGKRGRASQSSTIQHARIAQALYVIPSCASSFLCAHLPSTGGAGSEPRSKDSGLGKCLRLRFRCTTGTVVSRPGLCSASTSCCHHHNCLALLFRRHCAPSWQRQRRPGGIRSQTLPNTSLWRTLRRYTCMQSL
jgi:hypothetical protein